jgi:Fur family transcriptional regulator, peroxide stress response regulator
MDINETRNKLVSSGLKVTPQRIAIFEAVAHLNNHPTVEQIIDYIRKNHPNVAIATVYKVLDALVNNKLIARVNTEKDITRYDAVIETHHHIYFSDSKKIEDYVDHELNDILKSYFKNKEIPGITVEDIKLQIIGKTKN